MNYGFDGQRWHTTTVDDRLTANTYEELAGLFEGVRAKVAKFLATDVKNVPDEMVERGVPKSPPSQAEVMEKRRAQARLDYAERLRKDAARSPEAVRLKAAQQRAEEQRRSKLSSIERELEDATAAANVDSQRRADEVRREEICQTPAYQSTLKQARELVFIARLDESVTSAQLAQFEGQLSALEETQDVATVRSNLRVLQKAVTDQLAVEAEQLKQASNAIAMRKSALGNGMIFDDLGLEVLGEQEYVVVTLGTEVRKITKERYDSRESDESLRTQLFGGETHV